MQRLGRRTITNTGRETDRCRDWGHGQSQTRTERQTDEETGETDNHKHGQTKRQTDGDRQRSVRGNGSKTTPTKLGGGESQASVNAKNKDDIV